MVANPLTRIQKNQNGSDKISNVILNMYIYYMHPNLYDSLLVMQCFQDTPFISLSPTELTSKHSSQTSFPVTYLPHTYMILPNASTLPLFIDTPQCPIQTPPINLLLHHLPLQMLMPFFRASHPNYLKHPM